MDTRRIPLCTQLTDSFVVHALHARWTNSRHPIATTSGTPRHAVATRACSSCEAQGNPALGGRAPAELLQVVQTRILQGNYHLKYIQAHLRPLHGTIRACHANCKCNIVSQVNSSNHVSKGGQYDVQLLWIGGCFTAAPRGPTHAPHARQMPPGECNTAGAKLSSVLTARSCLLGGCSVGALSSTLHVALLTCSCNTWEGPHP